MSLLLFQFLYRKRQHKRKYYTNVNVTQTYERTTKVTQMLHERKGQRYAIASRTYYNGYANVNLTQTQTLRYVTQTSLSNVINEASYRVGVPSVG